MSREETPTNNPIIEARNGWMKEELYLDFRLAITDDVHLFLDRYVYYFNNRRPAAALGYKSPVQSTRPNGASNTMVFLVSTFS